MLFSDLLSLHLLAKSGKHFLHAVDKFAYGVKIFKWLCWDCSGTEGVKKGIIVYSMRQWRSQRNGFSPPIGLLTNAQ